MTILALRGRIGVPTTRPEFFKPLGEAVKAVSDPTQCWGPRPLGPKAAPAEGVGDKACLRARCGRGCQPLQTPHRSFLMIGALTRDCPADVCPTATSRLCGQLDHDAAQCRSSSAELLRVVVHLESPPSHLTPVVDRLDPPPRGGVLRPSLIVLIALGFEEEVTPGADLDDPVRLVGMGAVLELVGDHEAEVIVANVTPDVAGPSPPALNGRPWRPPTARRRGRPDRRGCAPCRGRDGSS